VLIHQGSAVMMRGGCIDFFYRLAAPGVPDLQAVYGAGDSETKILVFLIGARFSWGTQ